MSLWCITPRYLVNKLWANPAFYGETRERHLVTKYSALGRGNTVRLADLSPAHLKIHVWATAEEGRSLDLVLRAIPCACIFPFTFGSQSFLQIYMYVNEAAKLIQHVGRRGGGGGSKYKISYAWASFAQHRWYPVLDTGHIRAWNQLFQCTSVGTTKVHMGKPGSYSRRFAGFPAAALTCQGKSWERNPNLPTSSSHTPSRVFS